MCPISACKLTSFYPVAQLKMGLVVPLDRHFVIYLGAAGVDEGAGVKEGGPLI